MPPERRHPRYTMTLDPEDAGWAKGQPGGLSGTIRRLLRAARRAAEQGGKEAAEG